MAWFSSWLPWTMVAVVVSVVTWLSAAVCCSAATEVVALERLAFRVPSLLWRVGVSGCADSSVICLLMASSFCCALLTWAFSAACTCCCCRSSICARNWRNAVAMAWARAMASSLVGALAVMRSTWLVTIEAVEAA